MNTIYHVNRIQPIQFNLISLIDLLIKLAARLPKPTGFSGEAFALRYIASKYYGEID